MKKEIVYQVRVKADESADNVVTALTHAVWTALRQMDDARAPDPHRWAGLYKGYQDVFKKRLLFYKGCGSQPECVCSAAVYGGENASGPTYLLSLRGGLMDFVQALGTLAWRRFRAGVGRGSPVGRNLRDRFQGALHRALIPYLFYNEACSHCHVRNEAPERRIWGSEMKKEMRGRAGDALASGPETGSPL